MSDAPREPGVDADLVALSRAGTLAEFDAVVNSRAASASSADAVLYSKKLSGGIPASNVAREIAAKLEWSVLYRTARGQLLSSAAPHLIRVLKNEGLSSDDADRKANDMLYGETGNAASIKASYWGQASREFAATISGRVLFIGPNAEKGRVFSIVEQPALEATAAAAGVNNIPLRDLIGNHAAFEEIKRASALIIGSDGIVALSSPGTDSPPKYVLSREGGARLGLSAAELAQLPTYSNLMEIPGAKALQEPVQSSRELPAPVESAALERAAVADAQRRALSEPQRALLETLKEVMRQRGDSERAVTMAESIAAERFQRLNAAAGKADRAPQTTVPDRAAERVVQRPNVALEAPRIQELAR
jgi:hypothetical protein